MSQANQGPVVVSFYSDRGYYQEAAERLRQDCRQVGIDHDISPCEPSAKDWVDACRSKVPFFLKMHRKYERPILWLDVDSRLAAYPSIFHGTTCDIAGFLRGFRYLPHFDPLAVPRFFAPFALYFNATAQVTAFLEMMAKLEEEFSGSATDDYFLQEAWKQHRDQLAVMVLPPDLVGHEWPLRNRQIIYAGISGDASKFKSVARQHVAEVLEPSRRKTVLLYEAESARKAGRIGDALLLYKYALALTPEDDALAAKIARLAQRTENERSLVKSIWRRWLPLRRTR